jgi:acyl-CoA synthetase (AMP-forming)/AMP-acid ligase II
MSSGGTDGCSFDDHQMIPGCGPTGPEPLTLPRLLLDAAANAGNLYADSRTIPADQMLPAVRAVASWLYERGVRQHSVVSWQIPSGPDFSLLYWGTWWLGAVAVPFHSQVTAAEAAPALEQIGRPHYVIGHESLPLADLEPATMLRGGQSLLDRTGEHQSGPPIAQPDDLAVILTTSGSSGKARLVLHSQRALAHKARQLPDLHGTSERDTVLVPASLAHMAGLIHGVMHPVASGATAVIMPRWDAARALALVKEQRVTMLFGPPIFALGIEASPGFSRSAVESVRLVASGGTGISEEYATYVRDVFGATVKRTYGSTEAPIVTNTFPGDPPRFGLTTDGRPVPGAQIEIRDMTSRDELPRGSTGEIWIRGPELCLGYLDKQQTADAFVDGWFKTRDLGIINEHDFLSVVGRTGDVIIRGGMNISARDVENALTKNPAVREAVVLGHEDPAYGERVVAFVVSDTELTRSECVHWFAQLGVAKYKVPDRIHRVSAIPLLPGYQKPDTTALRALLSDSSR